MEYTKNLMNCLKCHHRNPENGNCVAVGGFCTAVPAAYCPLIPELLARCTRLEEARERANEACAKWEARAERAEKELARMKGEGGMIVERLTYWCDNGIGGGEWRVNVKGKEESGPHVDVLAAIENIFGDTYDLDRLRELLEVCKGKTPDQVAGIFEEWSHYLKFFAEKNAIEGALNSIYQEGELDYERLRELVEACEGLEPREIAESKLLIATRKDPEKLARMAELVEADRDGRCVVLPCKKGETLKRNGLDYKVDHVNIVYTTFAHDETVIGRERLGLFTVEQAEAALNERKAVDDSWLMKRFTKVI